LIINEGQRVLGDDTVLDGAGGDDTLIGSSFDETFFFNSGNDSIDGGGGIDTLSVGGGPVTVDFRTGAATSAFGRATFANIEQVFAGSGDDSLTANDSGVRLFGFAGNDTLIGGAGNDFLIADGTTDFAAPTSAGGADVVTGGGGNDDIWLGTGNDQADAGTGNDRFVFQGQFDYGNDTISGGDGVDEIFFDAFGPLAIDLGAGTLRGGSALQGAGSVSFTGIENFSMFGNAAAITGSSAANNLGGGGESDTINGSAGNDTLTGADGADNFIFDQAAGAANADLITDFQPATDSLSLSAAAMPALGASGRFAAGDARFHAAAGATGGHDADDRVVYDTSTGKLFYDADGSGAGAAQLVATLQARPNLAATDILVFGGTGAPGVHITGTAGNDTLDGTDRNDTIDGLGGDDLLSGRFGVDLVRGGDGNDRLKDREDSGAAPDTLDGGLGDDIFDLLASPLRPHNTVIVDAGGVDTVWSNHDIVLPAGIENLTLFEGRSGTGNDLANQIIGFGNIRDYAMDGAGGNDTLVGAPNSTDNMTGGAGNDVFRLLAPPSDPAANLQDNLMDFVSARQYGLHGPGCGRTVQRDGRTVLLRAVCPRYERSPHLRRSGPFLRCRWGRPKPAADHRGSAGPAYLGRKRHRGHRQRRSIPDPDPRHSRQRFAHRDGGQ
jgi:Ca2+-binding RTX toxin-like protein